MQPGVVLDDLRDAAERHHLTFGPDPATHNHCTLGGMIGNNSCGVHSVMAGKTVDNTQESGHPDLRRPAAARGPDRATTSWSASSAKAGGAARSTRRLRDLRDRYGDLVRERFPKIPAPRLRL